MPFFPSLFALSVDKEAKVAYMCDDSRVEEGGGGGGGMGLLCGTPVSPDPFMTGN